MGWEIAERRLGTARNCETDVTAKLVRTGGRALGRLLQIVLREKMEARCSFLRGATHCAVLMGTGKDIGRIRIEPGGSYPIVRAQGRLDRPATLNLEPPAGVTGVFMASACRFSHGEEWIEIELPEWARTPRMRSMVPAEARAV